MIPDWEIYQETQNGLYGYRDPATGQLLNPGKYADALPFSHGLAAVCLEDSLDHIRVRRWGYINALGEIQIPFIFSEAEPHKDTLQISDRISVIVAKVEFLPRILLSNDPDENLYYVDLLGNCISQKSAKIQQDPFHAQGLYKNYLAGDAAGIFFKDEGQIVFTEEWKRDIDEYIKYSLIRGFIPKILSGEMQFKIEGYQSSGIRDLGASLKRADYVQTYMQKTYPSLSKEEYYIIEDRGADADTSLVSDGDRKVYIRIVKKDK